MKKRITLILFLFIALLSACNSSKAETTDPVSAPAQTEQDTGTANTAVKATFPDYIPYDCEAVTTEPTNANRVFCINQDDTFRTLDGKDGRPSDVALLTRILAVFPRRMRERIIEVEFSEEDLAEGVAGVMDANGDGIHWTMWVNTNSESNDSEQELMETIAHELMHYLTLNNTQRSDDKQSCGEAINVLEYCPKDGTVFKDYINRFWQPIWKDWGSGDYNDYYDDHPDDFVSPYAVTDPGEDIAESFSMFVFNEKPANLSLIKDQKVDYFWQFPEFVTVREEIRSNFGK